MISPYLAYEKDAVSIITCTKRRQNMDTLFHNYDRQNYRNKELIVILNHPSLKLSDYIRAALPYPNVRVYSLPGHVSLGSCLNYGVKMARYGLIAKFDDDDYYAPGYLSGSRRSMVDTNADIVGKRAHFMYLNGKNCSCSVIPNGLINMFLWYKGQPYSSSVLFWSRWIFQI